MASLGPSSIKQKGTNDNVKVFVRVRPFNPKEIDDIRGNVAEHCTLEAVSDTLISSIHPRTRERVQFPFDRVFWSIPSDQVATSFVDFADQASVYNFLGVPTLDAAFEGYNGCIFAYGQTSSGKTHTMQGDCSALGVIPRLSNHLFEEIQRREDRTKGLAHTTDCAKKVTHRVELSYLEIYNEKLKDLLPAKSKSQEALELFHDPKLGPIVRGLESRVVFTWSEVEKLIDAGFRSRTTASTAMNAASSRSHAVLQLTLTQTESLGIVGTKRIEKTRRSRINLVDLAGSEKVKKSEVQGQHLKEAVTINKSLTTLGRVIDMLVTREGHIPYRDSLLTSLLSDSIGGNSRTCMIAALSPAAANFEETLSTLRYASRTRMIINVVKVNEDASAALIRDLQDEVARLRANLGAQRNTGQKGAVEVELRSQVQQTELLIETLRTRESQEKQELERREQGWEQERADLESKHRQELVAMESRAERLLQRQTALLVRQQALEEDMEQRIRAGEEGKSRQLEGISQAEQQTQEALDKQAQATEQLMRARQEAAHTKAKLQRALEEKAALQAAADDEEELNGAGDGPLCDMCQQRVAKFTCPSCDSEKYCHHCDAVQHRAPRRSHHQRYPLLSLSGGVPCDMCGEQAVELYCAECHGSFCPHCDALKHKNPKRAHHVRTRDPSTLPGFSDLAAHEASASRSQPSSSSSEASASRSQPSSSEASASRSQPSSSAPAVSPRPLPLYSLPDGIGHAGAGTGATHSATARLTPRSGSSTGTPRAMTHRPQGMHSSLSSSADDLPGARPRAFTRPASTPGVARALTPRSGSTLHSSQNRAMDVHGAGRGSRLVRPQSQPADVRQQVSMRPLAAAAPVPQTGYAAQNFAQLYAKHAGAAPYSKV